MKEHAVFRYERYGTAEQITLKGENTVDVVPVVRCKDCKHRGNFGVCPMAHIGSGDPPYDVDEDYTKDDGFCDRGESKNG